ncbi:MAG TPA: hypothetical protein VGF14_07060 [Alphaproteobacteria bacterium]
MNPSAALFIDLRRTNVIQWPEGDFTQAYIVTGDLETTQNFFKLHHQNLKNIPQITCEITEPATLHLLTRQESVTRLSLPHEIIIDGLSDHFALDAIISWDHRHTTDYYKKIITQLIGKNVNHFSLYGVKEFDQWLDVQTFFAGHDFYFYDRFHAAKPGHESPYQLHTSNFGNIVAFGGWSRSIDDKTMLIRGPHAAEWTTHDEAVQQEEKLLLGMSSRHGLSLSHFTAGQIQAAVKGGLAVVQGDYLCPTDKGLWDTPKLVSLLL